MVNSSAVTSGSSWEIQSSSPAAPTKTSGVADILHGYLTFSLELGRDRPSFKAAGLAAARSYPRIREHMAEVASERNQALIALLLARRHEIGHPDPELAVRLVLDQIGAMLHLRLHPLTIPSELARCSDEEFVREVLRSACGYLELEAAASP